MEILDLYDNNFNKLDKTIIRRVDEIPNNTNIMLSYAIIKNDNKYLLEQTTARNEYKWCFAGENASFMASNVVNSRKFEIKTPDIVIQVNPERTDLVETREIDGKKCLVIELNDEVEVNGISIR